MSEEEIDLESLEGVGSVTAQKLKDSGVRSVLDLAVRGPSEVAEITGWDLRKATDLCNTARIKLVEIGRLEKDFVSATDLYKKRQSVERITTGCKNLDDLLAGGIETQAITEFYGEFGSGKTQLCHTLCVTVQTPHDQGGLEANAVYIDTENTFRPERLVGIAEGRGLDPDTTLKGVTVGKAYNSAHQELIISELGEYIKSNRIKLVIVDSAVAHYRAEFLGRGTLAERQQRLNRMLHLLLRTAEAHSVAIVFTNQVQSTPDVFFGDPSKPTGGHVVGHTSTYRIYLRKAGKNRVARMVDSPYHPEREVLFVLNEKGVDDPPQETAGRKK
ncbi:MAG: DNA repair and recombination protein RadA [Thaumarchaeota archaeon]|nr:DNA repair and recombination protein RadA [Nitrososphaerota archaeon]